MKIQESFLFFLLLHWARELFLRIPPFIRDPGNLGLFLDLDPWLSILNLGASYIQVWCHVSMYIVDHTYFNL